MNYQNDEDTLEFSTDDDETSVFEEEDVQPVQDITYEQIKMTTDPSEEELKEQIKRKFKVETMTKKEFFIEVAERLDVPVRVVDEFFDALHKKYWYFKLAKPFLPLVKFFVVRPLLKNKNSPSYWKKKDGLRYEVFCGKEKDDKNVLVESKNEWQAVALFCKNITEDGKQIDYETCKNSVCGNEVEASFPRLNHGFDDAKDDCEIALEDAKSAARFRGGELLSVKMEKGDMTTKLEWKCHQGHIFKASPALILRGGHWCPECTDAPPWAFGKLAKDVPFYAQLYYDDHDASETQVYDEHPLSSI